MLAASQSVEHGAMGGGGAHIDASGLEALALASARTSPVAGETVSYPPECSPAPAVPSTACVRRTGLAFPLLLRVSIRDLRQHARNRETVFATEPSKFSPLSLPKAPNGISCPPCSYLFTDFCLWYAVLFLCRTLNRRASWTRLQLPVTFRSS